MAPGLRVQTQAQNNHSEHVLNLSKSFSLVLYKFEGEMHGHNDRGNYSHILRKK